jgi:molecular chaperone GrpE
MMAQKKINISKLGKKTEGKKEIEHLKNQLARALADYDNLTKRVEREREDFGKLANARLIINFLSIYDMLEGAQSHLKDSGLAITIEEFVKVLEDEDFEKIKTNVGDKFDEEIHEAVEVEVVKKDNKVSGSEAAGLEASGQEGKITKIVLSGWKVKDGPIVRPAKVVVIK